ncbi:hypothetical protein B7463_g11229, partial [Scytalidium lignicola]
MALSLIPITKRTLLSIKTISLHKGEKKEEKTGALQHAFKDHQFSSVIKEAWTAKDKAVGRVPRVERWGSVELSDKTGGSGNYGFVIDEAVDRPYMALHYGVFSSLFAISTLCFLLQRQSGLNVRVLCVIISPNGQKAAMFVSYALDVEIVIKEDENFANERAQVRIYRCELFPKADLNNYRRCSAGKEYSESNQSKHFTTHLAPWHGLQAFICGVIVNDGTMSPYCISRSLTLTERVTALSGAFLLVACQGL